MPLFFISACDFTPRIHRDILKAQDLLVSQNFQEAVAKYQTILQKKPDREIKLKIHFQLGEVLALNFGQYEDAIFHFRKVQEFSIDPLWTVRAEERIADINFNFLKNYQQSNRSYQYLSSFTPALSDIDMYQFRMAMGHYYLRNYKQSQDIFNEILNNQNHQFYIQAYFQLGLIYFEKKEWRKSLDIWQKYINKDIAAEKRVRTKFLMANALERKELLKEAYQMYYSILPDYPNIEVVQNRLQSLYNRRIARRR